MNPEFEPSKKKKEKKKSKKENEIDRLIKEYRQNKEDNSEDLDYWDKDFEEEKGEETKKIKESKQILKHPFIASFDKFIINHLDEIEQMFKKSY